MRVPFLKPLPSVDPPLKMVFDASLAKSMHFRRPCFPVIPVLPFHSVATGLDLIHTLSGDV